MMSTDSIATDLDEKYILDAQDPNDPVWATDSDIAGMQGVDDPDDLYQESTPMVRNASGALEFFNTLVEELIPDVMADEPTRERRTPLETIRTRELGADKWRGRTATVVASASAPQITASDQRRRLQLTNNGPNVAYISSISSVAGAPNTFPLPVNTATFYACLPLETTDDVWMICAAGQSAVVSWVEEFDMGNDG